MTQNTTTVATAIAALITPMIGRAVIVTDKAGATAEFKIAKLDEKLGSLKDGSKGEYVILQRSDDEAVVISLHPKNAQRLVTKGEDAGMKLVPVAAEAGSETTEAAGESTDATSTDAAADEPKAPSKKELFMAVYKAGVAAGKDRKTIKADSASIGLSDAGFNTYYQSAKSGKWA